MYLIGSRSQMMSQCGKNKKVAHKLPLGKYVSLMFLCTYHWFAPGWGGRATQGN